MLTYTDESGMLEIASRSSISLANAVTGADTLEFAGRVRPPRPPCPEGRVRLYDLHAAKGLDKLKRFDGGKYRGELLVCYFELQKTSMDAVLLTDKHLVVIDEHSLEKRFKVNISDISAATTKGTGVLICIKPPTLSSSKYLSEALGVSSAVRERLLPCGDLEKAEFLASTISACCLAYAHRDTTSN